MSDGPTSCTKRSRKSAAVMLLGYGANPRAPIKMSTSVSHGISSTPCLRAPSALPPCSMYEKPFATASASSTLKILRMTSTAPLRCFRTSGNPHGLVSAYTSASSARSSFGIGSPKFPSFTCTRGHTSDGAAIAKCSIAFALSPTRRHAPCLRQSTKTLGRATNGGESNPHFAHSFATAVYPCTHRSLSPDCVKHGKKPTSPLPMTNPIAPAMELLSPTGERSSNSLSPLTASTSTAPVGPARSTCT
mmetsp:Transcript_6766/g.22464  ORF Transcript_6766/g.22464 Transcript_6766/m.22464 type:complete len:247 (+) Transcript_6766:512-1252(+)